jgi:hypothetical protein
MRPAPIAKAGGSEGWGEWWFAALVATVVKGRAARQQHGTGGQIEGCNWHMCVGGMHACVQ